jgi:hypothetical protein
MLLARARSLAACACLYSSAVLRHVYIYVYLYLYLHKLNTVARPILLYINVPIADRAGECN